MPEDRFIETVTYLRARALENATALVAIGYSNALYTALGTAFSAYNAIRSATREAIADRSSYGLEVDLNMDTMMEILGNLDIEMNLLEYSHTQLFHAYFSCRRIVDPATHSTSHFEDTILANGDIKITDVTYDAATVIMINNLGPGGPVILSLRDVSNNVVGTTLSVDAGANATSTFGDLAPSGVAIWLKNSDGTNTAAYIIDLN